MARGGVERCFETETRLWGSETETRRDFGVSRSGRERRLYISCLGLSQDCGIRVRSRSRMFLVGVRNRNSFLNMLKPESVVRCAGASIGFILLLVTLTPIFG